MKAAFLVLIASICLSVGPSAAAARSRTPAPDVRFGPAPAAFIAECHATARAVGYAVPCPLRIPLGLIGDGGSAACQLGIVCPGIAHANTQPSWQGWVIGSSTAANEHLTLTASPHPLASYAELVDGPAWVPGERVEALAWVNVGGQRMREVYVGAAANEGSSFSDDIALIWSKGTHMYGVGFRALDGAKHALALDMELARSLKLVPDR